MDDRQTLTGEPFVGRLQQPNPRKTNKNKHSQFDSVAAGEVLP